MFIVVQLTTKTITMNNKHLLSHSKTLALQTQMIHRSQAVCKMGMGFSLGDTCPSITRVCVMAPVRWNFPLPQCQGFELILELTAFYQIHQSTQFTLAHTAKIWKLYFAAQFKARHAMHVILGPTCTGHYLVVIKCF